MIYHGYITNGETTIAPREVMKNQAICMLVDNGSNFCKVKLKVVFHCRLHVWTCSSIALSFIFTRFEVQFIFRTLLV